LVYRDAHHFPAFSPRKKQIFETPMNKTDELRTARIESLVTPAELAQRHPVTADVAAHVSASRRRIEKILNGEDRRLLVIIGPCSIHDTDAALEYARRLQGMRERYQPQLEIVMRTYFEKPRTVVGWKGLISDPDLNSSYRVNHGIELARRLLRWRNGSTGEEQPLQLAGGQAEVQPRFARLLADSDQTLLFLDDTSVVSRRAESLTLSTLGRFSASLAHEIRNPLAAINYATQLLEESSDLGEADRRLLQIIHQQCQRTNGIVESVLALARRERASPENLDLASFVRRFVLEYRQTLSTETDNVESIIRESSVPALMDPRHLHQILTALVHNALKYGRAGDEPAQVRIRVASAGRHAVIDVIDRGPGIPEAVAAQLFRPFYTTSEHGTGLGLYIAQELCRASQARLEYIPVPTRGACFRIVMPAPHGAFAA